MAVAASAIVGVWGLILDRRRRDPPRPFWAGVAVASALMLAQVGLGVALTASRTLAPGDQHVFYGIVIAFVFAFAYIYRIQLARRPALAYGTMGGEGQPQTQAALITRIVDFGYDVQQAIEAPRWLMGRTWGTASSALSLEARIPEEAARELALRGHPVQIVGAWDGTLGHAQAIRIDAETGFLEGGADPRGAHAGVRQCRRTALGLLLRVHLIRECAELQRPAGDFKLLRRPRFERFILALAVRQRQVGACLRPLAHLLLGDGGIKVGVGLGLALKS